MKKIAAALLAAMCCSTTFADALSQRVLLMPVEKVDSLCADAFKISGIYCATKNETHIEMKPVAPFGVPIVAKDRSRFDPPDIKVLAVLRLEIHQTDNGYSYYSANAEIYKKDWVGKSFSPTDRFEESVWSEIGANIPVAQSDSPEALSYLQQNDALKKAQADRTAARWAAYQAMQKHDAYEKSPAGQQELAAKSVEQCKHMIAAAQRAIARDNRIAAISGYENKAVREHAAALIVDCQETIAKGGRP